MAASNELVCFVVWPLPETGIRILCICLVGALPCMPLPEAAIAMLCNHLVGALLCIHYVIRPFPLCRVEVLHPAQMI